MGKKLNSFCETIADIGSLSFLFIVFGFILIIVNEEINNIILGAMCILIGYLRIKAWIDKKEILNEIKKNKEVK